MYAPLCPQCASPRTINTNLNILLSGLHEDGNHPVELSTNKMLDERLDYIHNNPVEAGWVAKPEHFKWSIAIDYCGDKGIIPVVLIQ